MTIDAVGLMNAEWEAWQESGEQLKKAGFPDGWSNGKLVHFHRAIVLWGERLVALRVPQTEEMRQNALREAISEDRRNKPT
jgi:hypothetical protein